MYVLELAFDDTPDRLAARPAHRERLQALHAAGQLMMAGPFADDSGALLIFHVTDAAQFKALVGEDPYYVTPGVTIVRQEEWAPILQ